MDRDTKRLGAISGQSLSRLHRKDGLPDNSIGSLFVDHAGTLWIVAGGNLSRLDGAQFTNFQPERDIPMRAVRGVTEEREAYALRGRQQRDSKLEDGKFSSVFEPVHTAERLSRRDARPTTTAISGSSAFMG